MVDSNLPNEPVEVTEPLIKVAVPSVRLVNLVEIEALGVESVEAATSPRTVNVPLLYSKKFVPLEPVNNNADAVICPSFLTLKVECDINNSLAPADADRTKLLLDIAVVFNPNPPIEPVPAVTLPAKIPRGNNQERVARNLLEPSKRKNGIFKPRDK